MRLLLDEHYSRQIAEKLRRQGHDVVSVTERPDLSGASDEQLLRTMAEEGRTIVTENVADFMPLLDRLAAAGVEHAGVVFTSPRSMPRSRATIGRFVRALGTLLGVAPSVGALRNQVRWLRP